MARGHRGQRGIRPAILVSSDDGLDELGLGAPLNLAEVISADRPDYRRRIDPATRTRVAPRRRRAPRGGDVAHNVEVTRAFLEGRARTIFDSGVCERCPCAHGGGPGGDARCRVSSSRARASLDGHAAEALRASRRGVELLEPLQLGFVAATILGVERGRGNGNVFGARVEAQRGGYTEGHGVGRHVSPVAHDGPCANGRPAVDDDLVEHDRRPLPTRIDPQWCSPQGARGARSRSRSR